ncbi:hypothetical protein [Arthrobacter sp. C9C5]|uniref:hypothetical protein n=1 Tax=Arthrobacter sp. C9C5 TaxID=2735267 RepID=UPI00158550B0|nr:hypothetical protein [Arthrobacter sp. C9C5]NUU30841.1 hypothetical protein [Arthrobacter sp. C9C5]
MTEACNTAPPAPASGNPCQECPFRKSNAGREHPTNGYKDDNFTKDWREIAHGSFFACHVFAPDLHPYSPEAKAAGYVAPVETGARPECAGAAIAIQSELDAAKEYGSHGDYIKDRPAGLTRKAFRILEARRHGTLQPAFKVPARFSPDAIRDPNQDVDTSNPAWVFGAEGLSALLTVADAITGTACACPVCTDHGTVHPAQTIETTPGGTALVDAPLAALLDTMNRQGIRTTDSCQNLREAVTALWPERLPTLTAEPTGTVNYGQITRSGSAFIRMHATNPAEQRFIRTTQHLGEWQTAEGIAQLSFPLQNVPALTRAAGSAEPTKDAQPL